MIEKIDHLGIAVKSLDEWIPYYRDVLGLEFGGIEEVAEQKVRVAFFKIGESKIELLEATSEDSPIAKFIEKRGGGIHHVSVKTDDIKETLSRHKEKGYHLIDDEPRTGAHNMQIAFIHPKSTGGVLVEVSQKPDSE